ncbi:MAG: membrane protein insertion efficiency factor YidD [Candidatus Zixiibacteriota bacterium]|nr:MAG: membrane protein insertion efficiency factor YidD [candidate division Zixibacteria bacterium]
MKPITWPSRIAVALIDLYRASFSAVLGGQCRFYPSCSAYARQAVLKYGLIRGGGKSLWRLLRCNPLHPGGVDEP